MSLTGNKIYNSQNIKGNNNLSLQLDDLQSNDALLQIQITNNASLIDVNINDISMNAYNISENTNDISANYGNILNNAYNINLNTNDISTNAYNISVNAGNISNLDSEVHDSFIMNCTNIDSTINNLLSRSSH